MSNLTIQSFMESKQQIKPMTKEQEFKLIKLAQQGDRAAYNKMFKQWIPFIISNVIKYSRNHKINEYFDDAVQECSLNFKRAMDKFDETKNKRFSTYLYNWVRQALYDFERKNTMGQYYPRGIVTQSNKYQTAHKNLLHQLDREPTINELSQYLGWSKNVVKNVQKYLFKNNVMSLDYIAKVGLKSEELIPGDLNVNEENIELNLLQNKLEKIINTMKPRDKYILSHTYGLGGYKVKSVQQMSIELCVSDKMVYRAQKMALERFKVLAEKFDLQSFL